MKTIEISNKVLKRTLGVTVIYVAMCLFVGILCSLTGESFWRGVMWTSIIILVIASFLLCIHALLLILNLCFGEETK